MAGHRRRDYDLILGNLICDRLGLDPNKVRRDGVTVERINPKTVFVAAVTMHSLSADEMHELETIAHARYMAGELDD